MAQNPIGMRTQFSPAAEMLSVSVEQDGQDGKHGQTGYIGKVLLSLLTCKSVWSTETEMSELTMNVE